MDNSGIGVDTTLLLGVDSYIKSRRTPKALTDPLAAVTFTHALDAHLDVTPVLLVLPEHARGYLPPVASVIADAALTTTNARQLAPMREERGVELYREHFALLDRDDEFLQAVVAWSWYQFFDRDALLGYHTRMQYESIYLDSAMGREFNAAAASDPALIARVANAVALECANRFSANRVTIRRLLEQYNVWEGDTHRAADAIASDVSRLGAYANELHLSSGLALPLLIIAFSGSVFRRGWQYGAVYQHLTHAEAYLPHPLRSAYMRATTAAAEQGEEGCKRVYFWSWGSLFARALQQAPTVWTNDELLLTAMARVRAAGLATSLVWQPGSDLDDVLRAHATAAAALRELAIDCGIVLTTDDVVERWNEIITWSSMLLPHLGAAASVLALHPILHGAAVPVELLSTAAVTLAEHKFGSRIDPFVTWLRERLLTHVLRVGGQGVARKIVGLDWSEDDSIMFAARRAVVAPTLSLSR
jgi:hypothetical protein